MIAAVVLAGGHSRRMGQPKALLPWRGRPLLAHIVAQLPCAPIVVVAPEDAPLPPLSGVLRVFDPREGPLPALHAGLAAVTTELVYLSACDTPHVTPAHVERLAAALGDADAAVTTDATGQPNWLVSVVRRAAVTPVAGERSLRQLFARLAWVPVCDPLAARDLDEPADLR